VSRDWFDSFNDAVNGLVRAARTQRNIRLHFLFAAAVVGLALLLHIGRTEFVVIGLVLVAELINSAVEGVVDLVAEHYHPLAKAAKDVAAGAVLVAAGVAVTSGYLILAPRLARPTLEALDAAETGPEYVTGLALLITVLLVVVGKAVLGKGEPLRGGMPSGHAAVAFAAATALSFLARDFLVIFLGFGLALLVAQSRLLYRIHTLREVVVGALLGILCSLLLFQYLK
jgi:diacylglycerol kinase (ATP)